MELFDFHPRVRKSWYIDKGKQVFLGRLDICESHYQRLRLLPLDKEAYRGQLVHAPVRSISLSDKEAIPGIVHARFQ